MSEEHPEGEVPAGEAEAGAEATGEVGEAEAGAEATGEVGEAEAGGGENEAEATAGEEVPDASNQESQAQEPAVTDTPPLAVEYAENEVQTNFTFSPTASNTEIARQLLETLETEGGVEEPSEDHEKETEEDADKEATEEGEEQEGDAADKETELAEPEQEIDDWIKETRGKKPKESRAMWDYSLYAPISMVQEQIVETYEELVLPIFAKWCEPMWDFDLLASPSMIESQVDETYELKLQLSSLRCEPMWDYQLSVPPEMALGQVYIEEKELQFDISSLKCHPMWDYDLNAPVQAIPEEIYWVPSYLNFMGVTREKFFHIEETPNTKFIQTALHFDPDIIIQPEDLLGEPNEEEEEKRRCYTDPQYAAEEIADTVDETDETWYPTYLNTGDFKKPFKLVGERCVVEETDSETTTGEPLETRGSEELADEVTSTEVQTDVGLGELLQSESISSVPEALEEVTSAADALNESEEQALVGDAEALDVPEESAPAETVESTTEVIAGGEAVEKGEPDVPWALLSETAIAPQPFLIPQEDDILSTVSLAPTTERQENKFNFAITIGGSVWGFPEYNTEDENIESSTVLHHDGEEFTWVPDGTTPFESSVFTPISEEDALLLESVHAKPIYINGSGTFEDSEIQGTDMLAREFSKEDEIENELASEQRELSSSGAQVSDMPETDELTRDMSKEDGTGNEQAAEQRDHSPPRAPIIEVEITMVPSAITQDSSETSPQIEIGVAWEALPESLADGRTPDIIVTTVLEEARKPE